MAEESTTQAAAVTATSTDKKPHITLYWLNNSRAHRIVWLLEELQVEYELKVFKRGKDMLAPDELKKIHPLGKSPVIGVQGPNMTQPKFIAESGLIVEYLIDHFGKSMVPTRWVAGQEGQLGGETEEWLRDRYFTHYAEGSLMTLMLLALFMNQIRTASVPFFIKPITRGIADRVDNMFLNKNMAAHFDFLEQQLASSPQNGDYFAGANLTGADIVMSFPLEGAAERGRLAGGKYPKLAAYIERIHSREAYVKATKKMEEMTGESFNLAFDPPK